LQFNTVRLDARARTGGVRSSFSTFSIGVRRGVRPGFSTSARRPSWVRSGFQHLGPASRIPWVWPFNPTPVPEVPRLGANNSLGKPLASPMFVCEGIAGPAPTRDWLHCTNCGVDTPMRENSLKSRPTHLERPLIYTAYVPAASPSGSGRRLPCRRPWERQDGDLLRRHRSASVPGHSRNRC